MGAGRLGPALVAYGLGNFVFYNEAGPSGESGVLQVTATGREIDAYSWVPARIVGGTPQPLEGAAADTAGAAWDALRECTGLSG
jgi:poly-gamma-glutamate synthesis protein (capsule biosynthesis protein)